MGRWGIALDSMPRREELLLDTKTGVSVGLSNCERYPFKSNHCARYTSLVITSANIPLYKINYSRNREQGIINGFIILVKYHRWLQVTNIGFQGFKDKRPQGKYREEEAALQG